MIVALIGAFGQIGSRVYSELRSRGHDVTAISRHASGSYSRRADILNPESLGAAIAGTEAVISAYSPPPGAPDDLLKATQALIDAKPQRLLTVGGAGSLQIAPGQRLFDSPDFPPEWKPVAQVHYDALKLLEASDLNWTTLSPAAIIAPGRRTGNFRIGTDFLLTDAAGESKISTEDFAVALVDELENPQHSRSRFCLAY